MNIYRVNITKTKYAVVVALNTDEAIELSVKKFGKKCLLAGVEHVGYANAKFKKTAKVLSSSHNEI